MEYRYLSAIPKIVQVSKKPKKKTRNSNENDLRRFNDDALLWMQHNSEVLRVPPISKV